jgi:hypothetical protein
MSKKHKIETFEDMLNTVTQDNIDLFINDLKGVLQSYLFVKSYDNNIVHEKHYTWINDGKNEIITTVTVKE